MELLQPSICTHMNVQWTKKKKKWKKLGNMKHAAPRCNRLIDCLVSEKKRSSAIVFHLGANPKRERRQSKEELFFFSFQINNHFFLFLERSEIWARRRRKRRGTHLFRLIGRGSHFERELGSARFGSGENTWRPSVCLLYQRPQARIAEKARFYLLTDQCVQIPIAYCKGCTCEKS